MATDPATCRRCGSTKLRHARSRHLGHRWIRAWTDWDRYACGSCGHRGWRRGKLAHRAHPERALPAAARSGRPAERRDLRVRRRLRLQAVLTIAVGLLLGVVVAWFVLRMAAMQPPPPE